MSRVLIISSVFPPEPLTSAMMNYDLADALSRYHNVTVLRPAPSRPIGHQYGVRNDSYDFECITVSSYTYPKSKYLGRVRESISFGIICAKYIERHRSEIDFVYNDGWQLFGLYIVARACVKAGIPYIVPIQDIYPESLLTSKTIPNFLNSTITTILLSLDKYYQKHAYKVRTITQEMANYLVQTRKLNKESYLVIDNWQNDEDYYYLPPLHNQGLVFAYVGSINAHSNTELIIKAFYEADIPNALLKIYGGGSHKETCKRLVERLGLQSKVLFELVDKKEVPTIQAQSNVLLLALHKGNGGLALPSKITSYMLSGRPILASIDTNSATYRYITDNNCGLCVEPDSISAMSDGFKFFAQLSYSDIEVMCENSRRYSEGHLMKTPNLNKLVNVINHLLIK